MKTSRNAYWALGLSTSAMFASVALFLAIAPHAGASWPFTVASADESTDPLIHDSELELLKAAVNPDPNPEKGESEISTTEGAALMANAGPYSSIAAIEGRATGGAISTYVVKDGDSISEIASSHGVSVNTILWANGISDAATIKPGTSLVILPITGVRVTVASGDTLATIAKKYGGEVEDIASYNGIDPTVGLTAGAKIIVPGGELPKTAPKAATTKAKAAAKSVVRSLPAISGYFGDPLPAGRCTQGVHGYNGVDIGAPSGTPIYAAAAGKVTIAKGSGYNGGYGSYVVISHDNGTQTLYAHMSSVTASSGASVSQGQLIGYVGNTGKSTGNHLHFEVRGAKNPRCK